MGYVAGLNLYEYVDSSPTDLLDPEGLAPETRPTTGPTTNPSDIPWNQLQWSNFKGTPAGDDDAFTAWQMSRDPGRPDVKSGEVQCGKGFWAVAKYPNFVVKALFVPEKSFVRADRAIDPLLNHERLHLRLARVGAAREQTALRKIEGRGSGGTRPVAEAAARKDLDEKINAALSRLENEVQAKQQEYDNATGSGTNDAEQAKWEKLIAQWESRGGWD